MTKHLGHWWLCSSPMCHSNSSMSFKIIPHRSHEYTEVSPKRLCILNCAIDILNNFTDCQLLLDSPDRFPAVLMIAWPIKVLDSLLPMVEMLFQMFFWLLGLWFLDEACQRQCPYKRLELQNVTEFSSSDSGQTCPVVSYDRNSILLLMMSPSLPRMFLRSNNSTRWKEASKISYFNKSFKFCFSNATFWCSIWDPALMNLSLAC